MFPSKSPLSEVPDLMDLRRIRHFVVLAETLNFHRAAERLHIAQPALSVSIQKLEAELDITLFSRDARGVTLTAAGRAALAEARLILFHGGQLSEVARAASCGTGGVLRIGFVGSATLALLPRLVSRFHADYPGVELVLRESTSVRIMQMLDEEALDVGLVRTPLLRRANAELLQLEHDQFVAALPRAHPLAGEGPMPLAGLAQERFVMYAPDEGSGLHSAAMMACQLAGFLPRVRQEAIQIQTVLALVESGLGVGLVPSIVKRWPSAGIVYRAFTDFPLAVSIGLALVHRPGLESQAAHRFRELAEREFPLGTVADGTGCAGLTHPVP